MPDAVVFLDMNPLTSWRRQSGNVVENDRLEAEKDEFHLAVYRGFKELAATESRYIRIEPDEDKLVTSGKIIDALRARGIIE